MSVTAALPLTLAGSPPAACEGLSAVQVALGKGVSIVDPLSADDPLLELEQLYVASADASNNAYGELVDAEDDGAHPAEIARLKRESDRLLDRYNETAEAMADAVPIGPAGVAVKARRLLESMRMGKDGSEEANLLSILAWAAAATAAPQDGPMILGSEEASE